MSLLPNRAMVGPIYPEGTFYSVTYSLLSPSNHNVGGNNINVPMQYTDITLIMQARIALAVQQDCGDLTAILTFL